MPRGRIASVGEAPTRRLPPPSRALWRQQHPTIAVTVDRATYEGLDVRRKAEGRSFADILLGDRADRDRELAEACAHGRLDGEAAAQNVASGQLNAILAEHQAAMAAAAEQIRAADEAGYRRALAAGDDPAARAASHRQAAVTEALERMDLSEVARYEAAVAARHAAEMAGHQAARLRAAADQAEAQRRLDAASYATTAERVAELEDAATIGARRAQEKLAPQVAQLQAALADRDRQLAEQGPTTSQELAAGQRELDTAKAQVAALRVQVQALTEHLEGARHSPLQQLMTQRQEQMALARERWDAERAERAEQRAAEQAIREQRQQEEDQQQEQHRQKPGHLWLIPTLRD